MGSGITFKKTEQSLFPMVDVLLNNLGPVPAT